MASTAALRVVRRFLAHTVRVDVDVPATMKAREQFSMHGDSIVATFASPTVLYRIFDGEELAHILRTGKITGGTYSVKAERTHGASWGSDLSAIVAWGNRLRGARLGTDLFVAKLEAEGKKFYHLDPGIVFDPSGPPSQTVNMDLAKAGLGLGASVMDVSLGDVDLFKIDTHGQLEKITTSQAKEYVDNKPIKEEPEVREVHPKSFKVSILGVSVRVFEQDDKWYALLDNDKKLAAGVPTKQDAIDLAEMAIKFRPSNPIAFPFQVLVQHRQYAKHFDQDEDPEKIRGSFALKPKDQLEVTKGSRSLGISLRDKLTVADVWQIKGEREVRVKLLDGRRALVLYATHPNRLADESIALLNGSGDRILLTRRKT